MDNNEKQKPKRGRPPLSPEMREQRRIERNKKINEYHRASGYAARKKHIATYGYPYYEPKIRVQNEFKETLDNLLAETKLSITQLFLTAVEEKYSVILSRRIDKIEE